MTICFILFLSFVNIPYTVAKSFDAPPKSTVKWVTKESSSYGLQLQVRRFESNSLSQQQVLDFYRRQWGDQGAETDAPPWKMIGTSDGNYFWNVQVQSTGRKSSWGYLSVSDIAGIAFGKKKMVVNMGEDFPKMSGSTVVNDFHQEDLGRSARTLLLQNDYTVSSNVSYYKNYYEGRGYTAVMNHSDDRNTNHVLLMSKIGKEVTMTIHTDGSKTNVVANEVKHGF